MLTVQNAEAIRRIEEAIGYTFHDKRLLVQVLTRKTYLKIDPEAPDNEVLEFYGDTLMNYHVTNYFMSKYAHMLDDGLFFMRTVEQFTDMRSHYVCNRYLTERVKAMGLARYVRAQNREAELRRDGEKAYADIFESLVGAIYLDSYQNDNLIRAFILRQLGIEPKRAPADIESFDYDSLREPPFSADEAEPDEVAALAPVETEPVPAAPVVEEPVEEEAATEETAAAPVTETPTVEAAAPETEEAEEAVLPADETAPAPAAAAPATTREKLALLCESLGYEQPTYGETPPNAPNARPVAACTLKYRDAKGKLVKISLNDSGKTLDEATEKAAAKMLAKLTKLAAGTSAKTEKTAGSKAEKRPAAEVPVETAPAEEVPVEVTPAEAAPVEKAPVVVTPAEATPVEVAPVEVTPAEATPVEKAPVEVTPAEATPVEKAPVEMTPAEATPVEVAPAEATPVEMAPVEVAPVEVTPVEMAPVEAAPVAEKPAKKAPQKKKAPTKKKEATPAEAAPAEEAQPAKVKKTTSRKKAAPPEDKPAETAPVTEVPAEPVAEEAKPAKAKNAPARKKAVSKKETKSEATDAQTE